MPQLCIETFVSQYFWLVVLFFGFYLNMVNWAIPKIAQILKLRNELSNVPATSDSTTGSAVEYKKSIILTSPVKIENDTQAQLDKVVLAWCDSKLK